MTMGDNSPEHSDYWAVRRTVDRYFAAIDRADKSLLASVFTEDAVYESEGGTLNCTGRVSISDKLASGRFKSTSHVTSSMAIDLDGDGASADTFAVAYLVDQHSTPERIVVRGVRYRDRLRREGAGWLIARRCHETQWQIELPSVTPWLP